MKEMISKLILTNFNMKNICSVIDNVKRMEGKVRLKENICKRNL